MDTGGRLIPPTGLVLMDYPWIWPQSTPTALLAWRFSGVHAAIPVRARKHPRQWRQHGQAGPDHARAGGDRDIGAWVLHGGGHVGWHAAGLHWFGGEGERPAAHRPQPADVVGVQVGDHHGVQVAQARAQHRGMARKRGLRLATGQPGVEQHPHPARTDQVGHPARRPGRCLRESAVRPAARPTPRRPRPGHSAALRSGPARTGRRARAPRRTAPPGRPGPPHSRPPAPGSTASRPSSTTGVPAGASLVSCAGAECSNLGGRRLRDAAGLIAA